jgi:pimeloyl-ACP methyl ester carboxylesterase
MNDWFSTGALLLLVSLLSACRVHDGATDGGAPSELAGPGDGMHAGVDSASFNCPAATVANSCNSSVGREAPLPSCSTGQPCDASGTTVTTPFSAPTCRAGGFDDGGPRLWTDPVTGEQRGACVFIPSMAGPASQRPLLVFLHGSMGSADTAYSNTSLRAKAVDFDLSGDSKRPGFVLAAVQGRNLHWPTPTFEGSHHDFYFRDLGSPSCNPDVRSLDQLIDDLVATGNVDPRRIYVSGWSNGAYFAQLYAIARHDNATPGGNRVAATAMYAGTDPFDNLTSTQSPSCKLAPYPALKAPTLIVHRSCDALVPCDAAETAKFQLPPGDVEDWATTLTSALPAADFQDVLLDAAGKPTNTCMAVGLCTPTLGVDNHLHWPNGASDGSGIDHEPEMLNFLRGHPLP